MFGLDIGEGPYGCGQVPRPFSCRASRPGFAPEQVIEVDTAGLTSPVLERFEWRGLPRPVYPLDEHAEWQPQFLTWSRQDVSDKSRLVQFGEL